MAKPKRKRSRKKSALGGLGFAPDEHKKRQTTYEFDARSMFRAVDDELESGKCDIAFSRLIDGVSYAGMAEAEASGAGNDSGTLKSLTASAIRAFRKSCKVAT